tara:strand:+ start:122 stop:568 length:447 start_codon:yes stop_codon:yes gene_type:complete
MNLYERMQRQSTKGPSNKRTYSFQGEQPSQSKSTGRFRARSSQPKKETKEDHTARFRAPRNAEVARRPENSVRGRQEENGTIYTVVDDTDRPYAYGPPEVYQEGEIYKPPGMGSILADLGLRMLEVAIAAVASEIAYFFTRRRFYGRR